MGLFCCFPFYNNFSAVVFITLKVILLRVAMLAMLNIMIREQAVLNWKNASQKNSKEIVLISNYEQQNYYNFSI